MKPIAKDELFSHLSEFFKTRGIEMTEGTYAQQIQKSCGLLTDAINLTQLGFERAKSEIDTKLDQMRQVIHEKTAPKSSPTPPPAEPAANRTPKVTARP